MRTKTFSLLLAVLLVAGAAHASGLPDPDTAKAADKCQKTIKKSGTKFTAKVLKSLEKCHDGIFKCVQVKPGDQKCIDKARAKCLKELDEKVGKEQTKFVDTVEKKCELSIGDLQSAMGLGYDDLVAECDTEFGITADSIGSTAVCIRRQNQCRAEEAFSVAMPRAFNFGNQFPEATHGDACFADLGGMGDVGDPKLGKTIEKCQKEAKKQGKKFLEKKLKSLEKCADAIFTCIQRKPTDAKCIPKATAKCDKELGRNIPKLESKFAASLDKRCAEIFDQIVAANAMNTAGLAAGCLSVGVSDVDTFERYQTCVVRRHECIVEDIFRFQMPRAEELLQSIGHELRSPYCAAEGEVVIQVTKSGDGIGTVTSTPAGIECGDQCVGRFPDDAPVELSARTQNGDDSHFRGWSGECGGSRRDCIVPDPNGPTFVDADFGAQTHNLVFSTQDDRFATNLGGFAPYDAACNTVATAAGLNNLAGDGFVAWVSTNASLAPSRLAGARGFMRMDGRPFADEVSDLTAGEIFNPVEFDEKGDVNLNHRNPLTATAGAGTLLPSCSDLSSNASGLAFSGEVLGGPDAWSFTTNLLCSLDFEYALYCFGTTKANPLVPSAPPAGSKRIYLTNTPFLVGVDDPDTKCEAEKPAGTGTVKALLATTTLAAFAHLDPGVTYVRPDGQVVGTGVMLLEVSAAPSILAGRLESGIWQSGDGSYVPAAFVWTGATDIGTFGTMASTCDDWSNSGAGDPAAGGQFGVTFNNFWEGGAFACNNTDLRLYCVEQ